MSRKAELIALLLADTIAFNLAFLFYYLAKYQWGWLSEPSMIMTEHLFVMLFFSGFWVVVFVFSGMYRERYAASRMGELISLIKVVTAGILILFFLIFIDMINPEESARANIFFYWAAMVVLVAGGRLLVRSVQKALLLRGYGTHKALIVGWSDRVEQLYQDVARYPAAGLNIVGAIQMRRQDTEAALSSGTPSDVEGDGAGLTLTAIPTQTVVEPHTIEALPRLIESLEVQDVLIALGPDDHHYLMEVLRWCDGTSVSLKLVPDFYSIIGGMAPTEHTYGLPLIEVLPEPIAPWEQSTKRLIDVLVSSVILIAGGPLWLFIGLLIRLTSAGPAIYRQQRAGQADRLFNMYKFRTMRENAEAETGPVWAQEDDPRYTSIGRWLRRTRLDEIPQMWNVLKGEMSLVGPRPERPYFVSQLAEEIPLYHRRHRVKPGITGLAQVKWKYDTNLDDVRQKVKYDLFYIANMSLRMDLEILFQTIRTAFLGKGQ